MSSEKLGRRSEFQPPPLPESINLIKFLLEPSRPAEDADRRAPLSASVCQNRKRKNRSGWLTADRLEQSRPIRPVPRPPSLLVRKKKRRTNELGQDEVSDGPRDRLEPLERRPANLATFLFTSRHPREGDDIGIELESQISSIIWGTG